MAKNKTKLLVLLSVVLFFIACETAGTQAKHHIGSGIGYIFLQVEAKGEAWYVYPRNGKSYFLGRPVDAFRIMRVLALGAKHEFIANTEIFPDRLSGMILLDVEKSGEAYYIYPKDRKKYYLGRPEDAFGIMRELGRGITNKDLAKYPIGVIVESKAKFDLSKKILLENVPFTSQAPFAGWVDQRQQDGCEESSSLMAVRWALDQGLTQSEALREITGISDWLLKKYGEYRDISARDTIDWIFKDYFQYQKAYLVREIAINDIIETLAEGRLVITPMNGQIMHNPNYRSPGPSRHMIVIRGYDPATKEFITNDPGTRKGELYRYNVDVLYEAIRDYPTGYHEIIAQIEKNMIVVER